MEKYNELYNELLDEDYGFLFKLRHGQYDREQYLELTELIKSVARDAKNDETLSDAAQFVGLVNNLYYDLILYVANKSPEELEEVVRDLATYI